MRNVIASYLSINDWKEFVYLKGARFKITITLILIFSIGTFVKSQSYITVQDINVRSGPGIEYKVIDKITGGTNVTIIENGEKWSKISTGNSVGYISSKYIKIEQVSSDSDQNKKVNNSTSGMWTIIGGIAVLVFLSLGIKWINLKAYNLFGFRGDRNNKIYQCTRCNETSMFKRKSSCLNGGYHNWREV
jgi:uncharacterized protein YraI